MEHVISRCGALEFFRNHYARGSRGFRTRLFLLARARGGVGMGVDETHICLLLQLVGKALDFILESRNFCISLGYE